MLEAAHPFFQNIPKIRIHFGYGLWLYICLWRKIGSIFFLEINTNALGNKTMCIITWLLQFCSFLAKPVRMRAWNIHVYILTFVFPVSDAFKQMNMDVLYIQSAWIRWLNSPYPSNPNSVCIYRALNFIGYSKSILCTLLNEFTFFLSAREQHLLYFDFFFRLYNNGNGKTISISMAWNLLFSTKIWYASYLSGIRLSM